MGGRILFPGAAMFEAARAAGALLGAGGSSLPDLALSSVAIPAPLLLPKRLVGILWFAMF